MRVLTIDWYYHARNGTTCSRCCDSLRSIRTALERVSGALRERGVVVDLREHQLGEDQLDRSNSVVVNGRDIMDILNEPGDIFTFCRSCTDLTGRPTECRIFIYKNKAFESIPEDMLIDALLREARAAA